MSYQQTIFLRLAKKLAIIQVSIEWIHTHLLQASIAIILPSHSLIDIAKVLYQLSYSDLAELGLESYKTWLACHALHAVHLHSIWSLLFKLPVGAVEHIYKLIGCLASLLDISHGFLILLKLLQVQLEVLEGVTCALVGAKRGLNSGCWSFFNFFGSGSSLTFEKHASSLPVLLLLGLTLLAFFLSLAQRLFALFLSFLRFKFLANLLIVVHLL